MNEASRIASEYGFEYGDVLTLLNGGVAEKKAIQVLSRKQRHDAWVSRRKQRREARELRISQWKEKARKKKEAWTPSLAASLMLSPKANERIEIAKKYNVENPEDYVMRKAVPIKNTQEEIRRDWWDEILGDDIVVRVFKIAALSGFTASVISHKLQNLSSSMPWYLWLVPVCFLSWVCSLLIRYYCWVPKWYLSLCLKIEQLMDKIGSMVTRCKNRHNERKQEIVDRHCRIAKKYFSQKDYRWARYMAESMAEKGILLKSVLGGTVVGEITLFAIRSATPDTGTRLLICLATFVVSGLVCYVFGKHRLNRNDKYFEQLVIKLRRREAIKSVTRIDFIGDFINDFWNPSD